jgi:hypothetical protein
MENHNYRIVTAKSDRELLRQASGLIYKQWPEFMLNDPVADHFTECYDRLGEYQFVLLDEKSDEPVALGNSIPLCWNAAPAELPEEGWDWAMTKGIGDFHRSRQPTPLAALQVVVFGANQGRGLSSHVVSTMKQIGRDAGLVGMIAPVRPTLKSQHPLVSIDQYIEWTDDDGLPFDPWLRVHVKLGARIIKPCHRAMKITGSVAEWEQWTGMKFPTSGQHIIPGALTPVDIDCEQDIGIYVEPNVWVYHPPLT